MSSFGHLTSRNIPQADRTQTLKRKISAMEYDLQEVAEMGLYIVRRKTCKWGYNSYQMCTR